MSLRRLIFGSPEEQQRRKEQKRKEREAYLRGFEEARVKRARKKGLEAGKTTLTERLSKGFSTEAKELGEAFGGMGKGFSDLFGLGEKPQRRPRRKAKTQKIRGKRGKTIIIRV